MRIEVPALLFFDTPLRAGDDLRLPRLDLVFGQTFRTHVLADGALHVLSGVPMIMDPLRHGAIFHDTVLTQDPPCPLQRDAELDMGPVEGLARRLQIRAALEVETVPLGHPRQIVSDPLPLERRVLRAVSIRATTTDELIPVPRSAVSTCARTSGGSRNRSSRAASILVSE